MLVRDSDGRLIIISRKDCKNESVYNEKIYNVRLNYTKKYKSVIINPPKDVSKELISKDFTDD